MKRILKSPLFWLAVIMLIGGWLTLRMIYPTNIAETAPDHKEPALKTRRYSLKGNLRQMRQEVEKIIPQLSTSIWGGKWKPAAPKDGDSAENKEIIRAEVPVVFFTDDLWVELKQEGNEVVVNARSNSRVGKSDLGENRRHLLQILEKLDERFGNSNS